MPLHSPLELDRALRAVADANRRAILLVIREGPLSVGTIAEKVGLSQQVTSHHLGVLKAANLANCRRVGKQHLFSTETDGLEVMQTFLNDFWPTRLSALKAAVEARKLGAMADYASSIEIDASPDEVFDFLVTDEGMTAWMGQYAALDPRVGGAFAVDIAGYAVRGQYLELDRPNRVVLSWGMTGNPALPPGTSKVSFTLTPTRRGGTRVDLLHSDLPETELAGHEDGWMHFLARLQVAASGGDPGEDLWTPITA